MSRRPRSRPESWRERWAATGPLGRLLGRIWDQGGRHLDGRRLPFHPMSSAGRKRREATILRLRQRGRGRRSKLPARRGEM